jgi:bacillithiol biosynthesis cysteine-adding enzyme BshC
MTRRVLPFERYPGVPPLFLDFVRGKSPFHPDPPTLDAAAARGRELLGRKPRIQASAFRARSAAGRAMAEELAAGRAVAVAAGHQVGLFTGPLFTLWKAFDVIRVARELTARGVPAVPLFWALTDDHDLEEVARTAVPGAEGPEVLVLEGADRSNRHPVGPLPIADRVGTILDAFRGEARAPDAADTLDAFAARYSPAVPYGDAFIETLFDLVEPDPLLVLDPLAEELRDPSGEFFRLAVAQEAAVWEALGQGAERLHASGRQAPVAYREGAFPFFVIRNGERRRVESPQEAVSALSAGGARISADVLTRPVLKSFLLPVAASVLGPAEIAYHAQALPLFPTLGVTAPVLLPRSHLIPIGPAERRALKALGISVEDLFGGRPQNPGGEAPGTPALEEIQRDVAARLAALTPALESLDPTLLGALENATRKISYQLEQLEQRMRKAAERRDQTSRQRWRRLETMLVPRGTTAERLYPPLVPLLAYGRAVLPELRTAAVGSLEGAVIVDLLPDSDKAGGETHAG